MNDAESTNEKARTEADHLKDVEDGCGCTEIWEHLSEQREASSD